VTAFFTTLNVDAIWWEEWGEEDKLAGRGKIRDRPTNEHHGIILKLILLVIRYSTAQSPSYPSQTRSATCLGSPSQDFSNHRVP